MLKPLATALLLAAPLCSVAQQILPLYPGPVPNATSYQMKEISVVKDGRVQYYQKVSRPTLTVFLPPKEKSARTGVVIFPGGGYVSESYEGEGVKIAETFVRQGIAAFVVKYRLPSDSTMVDKSIGPLQDAQQAIRTVRENAGKWGLDRIGIMGFSAGGHLASTLATHYRESLIGDVAGISLRPDFQILIYPVISMSETLSHKGSRTALLGQKPAPELIERFSNEWHVNHDTPPAYITHTGDDRVVDVDNTLAFYEALRHHHVPAEVHLYPKGDHGFVLKLPTDEWMQPIFLWMRTNKWL